MLKFISNKVRYSSFVVNRRHSLKTSAQVPILQLTQRWRQAVAATLLLVTPPITVLAQEQNVEVAGELDVLILEDFDRGHEEMAYFVREPGSDQAFELKFHQPPGHGKEKDSPVTLCRQTGQRARDA